MNRNNLRKVLTARSKAVEAVHWRKKQHRFQLKNLKEFEKSFRTKEGIFNESSLSNADADKAKTDYQDNSKRNPSSHTETSSSNKMVMEPSAQSNEYGTVGCSCLIYLSSSFMTKIQEYAMKNVLQCCNVMTETISI